MALLACLFFFFSQNTNYGKEYDCIVYLVIKSDLENYCTITSFFPFKLSSFLTLSSSLHEEKLKI